MRVGIYNQFLLTMGGGERHMGMVAEVLARAGHDVELITHVPASVAALATRFDLDLAGVRVRTTPSSRSISSGSSPPSTTCGSTPLYVRRPVPRARSMLLVLFPVPAGRDIPGAFQARLAGHIHRQLYVPRYGEGFFGPQELGGSRYRWTAGRGQVVRLP